MLLVCLLFAYSLLLPLPRTVLMLPSPATPQPRSRQLSVRLALDFLSLSSLRVEVKRHRCCTAPHLLLTLPLLLSSQSPHAHRLVNSLPPPLSCQSRQLLMSECAHLLVLQLMVILLLPLSPSLSLVCDTVVLANSLACPDQLVAQLC